MDGKAIISILHRVPKYPDDPLMDPCSGDGGHRELRISFEEKKNEFIFSQFQFALTVNFNGTI